MGSGVKRRALAEALAEPARAQLGSEAQDWQSIQPRVIAYLAAMGVDASWEQERLAERVRGRLESRAASAPLEDPVEAAVEETMALLDRWLASELGLVGDTDTLLAARAAVLGGGVPGWSARWAGITGDSLAAPIRAAMVHPWPELALLPMESATIELFGRRLARRVRAAILGFRHPPPAERISGGGA
jgi:hypothetical protein